MRTILSIGAVLLAFATAVFGGGLANIATPEGTSEHNEKLIKRANFQLFQNCPDLWSYWPDVASAKVEIETSFGARKEQLGWKNELHYQVKIKQETKAIPAKFRAWGHTLHYYLGAGKDPGIVIQKRESQLVCGIQPKSDGIDLFISVPELSFLGGK